MTDNAGGLSFQEAIQEALAEETAEEVDSEALISEEPSNVSDALEIEQPTIENLDEVGLFDDLVVDESNTDDNQPSFDEELLTIEIEGRPWTIEEIRAGVLMKADYTRKTQALAQQREENEKAITLWEALHGADAVRVVENLYRTVAGQGRAPTPLQTAPQVQPAVTDVEALVEAKIQERLASDPRLQALEQQEAMSRLEVVFSQIEENNNVTLTKGDKQQILEEAQASGTSNLQLVFDGLMRRAEKRKAERANVQKNATTAQRRGDDEELPPQQFGSFREALDESLREEGILDTVFNF
jgi:hypothetical protein